MSLPSFALPLWMVLPLDSTCGKVWHANRRLGDADIAALPIII